MNEPIKPKRQTIQDAKVPGNARKFVGAQEPAELIVPTDAVVQDLNGDGNKVGKTPVTLSPQEQHEEWLQWKRRHDDGEDHRNAISLRVKTDVALMCWAISLCIIGLFFVLWVATQQ